MLITASPTAPPPLVSGRERWITWRSFALGTLGAAVINALVPYNDYVVANTFLVNNYLPPIVMMGLLLLIVLVNVPLRALGLRALSQGELAVVLGMMLVSCSVPSQGLMRSLLPALVAPFHFGVTDPRFWKAFVGLELPSWMFPAPLEGSARTGRVVSEFYGRTPPGEPMPLAAWTLPLLGWGVLVAGMWGALLGMALFVRKQWAENERLPFPLAQIELSLIEPPAPGKLLNPLLRNRLFWIAAGSVFVLQGLTALNIYLPRYFPEIGLRYDLGPIMTEEPWRHFHPLIKSNQIYFTFIGVSYFIQTRLSFSIFALFLLQQFIVVQTRTFGADIPGEVWGDHHLGAGLAIAVGTAWVGRRFYGRLLNDALRGRDSGDDLLSPRAIVLLTLGGVATMVGWLVYAGMGVGVALGLVGLVMLAHLLTARVVAEVGLPFFRTMFSAGQVYNALPVGALSGRDVFFAGMVSSVALYNTRESAAVFAMHAQQVATSTTMPRRSGRWLILLLVWTLLVSGAVSAMSSLWSYYRYATPLTGTTATVLNPHATTTLPRQEVIDPLVRRSDGQTRTLQHSTALHVTLGFAIAIALQVGAMRYAAWPLSALGYFASHTWYVQVAWFSVMLGWGLKVLIVRFGGAKMFVNARPFFIGLILGEALATGFWLLVNLLRAATDLPYESVNFLPT